MSDARGVGMPPIPSLALNLFESRPPSFSWL